MDRRELFGAAMASTAALLTTREAKAQERVEQAAPRHEVPDHQGYQRHPGVRRRACAW